MFVPEELPGHYLFSPNKQVDYPFDKQGKKTDLALRALITTELQELGPGFRSGFQKSLELTEAHSQKTVYGMHSFHT